jgi:hypothetical protein
VGGILVVKNNSSVNISICNKAFTGFWKWFLVVIFLAVIISFFIGGFYLIFEKDMFVGLLVILITCTMIQYKGRTWSYIFLMRCWNIIKYGWE